jgi:hypothetical protein
MGKVNRTATTTTTTTTRSVVVVVVVRLYSTHTETRPQDGGEMVIGYKIMSDSAYGTGTRWSYGQSPQHSPPHPVVGGCSPPSPCDAKVTVSVGRNDGPLMGTAVAGRVGSRVDMDPDTARQHNPGTLSCSCFAPCVSTHKKHKKRFSFFFFYLAINFYRRV